MRSSAVILAGLVLTGTAVGDEIKPGGRYAVQPSDDGFVRLDTQTGAVSHCGRREGVWFCDKLVEDQTALEKRVEELAARLDVLAGKVDALAAGPPAVAQPAPAPVVERTDFTTRLMHRFYALIRRMKGGDGT
jgi:hypothetical protein